ncbi:MAG TPA: hypothetical protein PKD68_04055 [Candidatus Saccharibacteria bacterium]|nr:hypothetical protein [Candidatus Saccharibacteria bacterium]
MNFEFTPEFEKDVKRLAKKWRSIPRDIEAVKKYILPLYEICADDVEIAVYRQGFFNGKSATILQTTDTYEVVKMRLDVADLGRSDKVRIIFIAIKIEETIRFIELYAKSNKEREDMKRIRKYLS